MKVLVTGAAGFIGSSVAQRFINDGHCVVGLDNINDYYDPNLKFGRLQNLGIYKSHIEWDKYTFSSTHPNFSFIRMNIEDTEKMNKLFADKKFDLVVHLAAQPGVRYSITNPQEYVKCNINGFLNILEECRQQKVSHLVYASSSSVYGLNGKIPFSEKDGIAHPVSLYAATKKSNELMAHAYAHIYGLPVTGLRFFTVYGPWGRPDMSPFLFIDGILHNRPIKVFNNGDMWRDFTYIDDIVEGIVRIAQIIPQKKDNWNNIVADPSSSSAPYQVYNIGNQHPTKLLDYITCIEDTIGRKALKEFLPMQPGDVYQTFADSSALAEITGFKPSTSLKDGIEKTVKWFKDFYNI